MWQKIKLILKSVRQYKKYALITPLFMIGEALLECLMPFIMSMLIDSVGNAITTGIFDLNAPFFTNFNKTIPYVNANLNINWSVSILGLILTLVLMAGFSLLCGILGGKYAAKASVGMGTNLRSDLYKKIQSFSFANIDKFSSSSLVTRLTTDVNQVQMSFQMCIRIVVRAPLMMIFSAIMAFLAGGVMALIFILLVPVVAVGLLIIGKKAMKIFMRVFKRYDKLNESVQENVSGIRVVKSYVREEFEKQKFNDASNSMTTDFVKAEKIIAMNNPLINTTVHMSNILVIGLGSFIIWKSSTDASFWTHLTVGQMSSLLTYGIQILMNVMMLSMILVMLVMSLECIRRIGEVLEEEPTIVNPEKPLMVVENGDIEFKNVSFKYKETAEKNALSNINLKIKSGQFIGILGSTGSGKTSLVNLISRLYDVTEGQVLVGDHDVREYDLKTLRDEVSVVLQKNVLFSGTIESNLKWGNINATQEQMTRAAEIAQCLDNILAKPGGFQAVVEQGGANFSGGQKQRLCIARAILKEPKIMILDDSTSAVDTRTDKLIRKGLKEDLPTMTKIVIAQRISSIEDADQIIIMDNGHIDAIGTHDELLKSNKIYQEVYHTQNRVGGTK
ncbi:MAG: ABC transporter ATP-binding protein/permease [Bacilli bacterium]|nr:ABC transporter ATP-binding protein/permease [Bacilli bacterium]